MNRELAKYILTLKEEISLRIWLSAISRAARNGTANLMFKDLMIDNHLTRAQIDKYFKPYEAEKLQVIKVLVITENFISINFRKGTKQVASAHQIKIANSPTLQLNEGKTKTSEPPASLLPAAVADNKPVPKGFLTEIPKNYIPSNLLIRAIIGDYTTFFKQLQVDKAAFIGKALDFAEAAPPKVHGEDVKHFREIAKHFAILHGISNEDQIKRCFHRVYQNWWNFTDFIKNYDEPRFIHKNINRIITELQTLNNNNGKTADKRETELNTKISRARSKDYSKLAKSRKKDNS